MTASPVGASELARQTLARIVSAHGVYALDNPNLVAQFVAEQLPASGVEANAVTRAAELRVYTRLVEASATMSIHDAIAHVATLLRSATGLDVRTAGWVVGEFAIAAGLTPSVSEVKVGEPIIGMPAPGTPPASPPYPGPPPGSSQQPTYSPPPGASPHYPSPPPGASPPPFGAPDTYSPGPAAVPASRDKPKRKRDGSARSAVERAVNRTLRKGLLAFTAPDTMRQGRKERVEVGIARTADHESDLINALRTATAPLTEKIETADYMKVELLGDGFTIVPLSPASQVVAPLAKWEFDVIPTESGSRTLTIVGTSWLMIEGVERSIAVPSFDRQINVTVDVMFGVRQAFRGNWQWIIGTLAGLGGAIAAWIALFA